MIAIDERFHAATRASWTLPLFLFTALLSGSPLWAASGPCGGANPAGWACVCEELREFQAYGVEPMIEACQVAEETADCARCQDPCPSVWEEWVDCRLAGNTPENCAEQRVEAMACGACIDGQVEAEGTDQTLWVTEQTPCPPGTGNGTVADPFCSIATALHKATLDQTQSSPLGTKVAVCPGVYREAYAPGYLPATSPGVPPVILESVVQHEAVITGTDDWASGWQRRDHQHRFENVLPFSEQFNASSGWVTAFPMTSIIDAGPFGPPVGATEFQPGPTDQVYLSFFDSWGQGRFVYSTYVRPYGTTSFVIDLAGVKGRRPTYAVTLPPTTCTTGPHQSADGYGYEALANGWYRLWVASDLMGRDAKATDATHDNLAEVRLSFYADPTRPTEHAGVAVWGAQLEQYPLGRYRTEPSVYTPTYGAPAMGYGSVFSVYEQAAWTEDWGLEEWNTAWACPASAPSMLRSEQVFQGGEPLRQVLNRDELAPGTFFLDDGITYANHAQRWPVSGECPTLGAQGVVPSVAGGSCGGANPCTLYVAPDTDQPSWSSQSQSYEFDSLDVSTRQRVLRIDNTRNWTVRGLTIHGAAGEDIQGGAAVFVGASHFTFTDNKVIHNSGTGFGITGLIGFVESGDPNVVEKGERVYSTGTYVARNESSDNGIIGASLFNHLDIVVEDETYLRNNWRGRAVQHNGGFVGGCKFGWIDKGLFQGMTLADNYGNGLWYDHFSVEIDIVDLIATGNEGAGVYLEKVPNLIPSGYGGFSAFPNLPIRNTFRIKNAHIEGNRTGILSSDTPLVHVFESFIGNNHDPRGNGAQVAWLWNHLNDSDTPEGLPNGLHGWALKDNTYATCADDEFYAYGDSQRTASTAEGAVVHFMETLVSESNVFLAGPTTLNETGFITCPVSVPSCPLPGPVPTPGPMTGPFSLNDWRTYTQNHFGIEHDRCSQPLPGGGC